MPRGCVTQTHARASRFSRLPLTSSLPHRTGTRHRINPPGQHRSSTTECRVSSLATRRTRFRRTTRPRRLRRQRRTSRRRITTVRTHTFDLDCSCLAPRHPQRPERRVRTTSMRVPRAARNTRTPRIRRRPHLRGRRALQVGGRPGAPARRRRTSSTPSKAFPAQRGRSGARPLSTHPRRPQLQITRSPPSRRRGTNCRLSSRTRLSTTRSAG